MISDKYVEIKVNNRTAKYYEEKGYTIPKIIGTKGNLIYDTNSSFKVLVTDLSEKSTAKVNTKCDFCGTERIMEYRDYIRSLENGLKCCVKCKYEKAKNSNLIKYGVENPSRLESIKNKTIETNLKKFGCKWVMSNKSVQEKRKNTNIKKYGYEWANQNPEVMAKTKMTLYKNNLCETSRQQKYLHHLYGGEINYPCSKYNLDILLDNIDIEYNGGGHDFSVTMGSLSEEEFDRKEMIRNNIIKRNGYLSIKLISRTDKLPQDEILMNILKISKDYFSSTSHTWYEWHIDENKIRNAENLDGSFFDFGELRRIKESDI